MLGSDSRAETPTVEDADPAAEKDGLFSNRGNRDNDQGTANAGAEKEGLFTNWGSSEKPPEAPHPGAANEGLFSNWGSPDKSQNAADSGAEKQGLFSDWGSPDKSKNTADPGAEKQGLFSNWSDKDKPKSAPNTDADKGGLFSNWANKDKSQNATKEKGMFSDWGNKGKPKDKAAEKPGLFSNWNNKERAQDAAGPGAEKKGIFSSWGRKDKTQEDRITGMQPEPSVENKAKAAPTSNRSWFGARDKEPEAAAKDKGFLGNILGKKTEPADDAENKPGMFDKMLGRDKKRAVNDDTKKPGMFDNLLKRNRGEPDEDKKKKPGLFGRTLVRDKDKEVVEEKVSSEKNRTNKLPGFLTLGTSQNDDVSTRRKLVAVRDPNVSMRTVVKIPLLILILLVAFLCYRYQKAKENSLGSGMSGGMVAEYLEYAFPTQSDWCGHPVTRPRNSRVQASPLAALIVTNTTVFSKVADEYDKMIKIFPEMVVANQTKQSGQTAFILCITKPAFILTIDLTDNIVKLTKLGESCKGSSSFRDAVESAIDEEADDSFKLSSEARTETIPFAVTVNIGKMRAEFVLCNQGPDGCLEPVDFMKASFDKLNVKRGITDFALVYSENMNTFKSSPKYICEVSQKEIQMCWNPKTYAPVQCFKP